MELHAKYLPPEIVSRGSLRGREYAWPLNDIPKVIHAAQRANLLNLGGQLQMRMRPGTCEAYWLNVDTFDSSMIEEPWQKKVARIAREALEWFQSLQESLDLATEGRKACRDEDFQRHLAAGGDLDEALCFVWYLMDQKEWSHLFHKQRGQTERGDGTPVAQPPAM